MRHRAHRFLHVLLCAPVAAILVAVITTRSVHALAADATNPPPVVVAIDAGHGGSPDNLHPDQRFDSGTVGPNGLLEKDVNLDVAGRVRALLEADGVQVVMTRPGDVWRDITPRMQTAIDAHAQVFVSIHMNGFLDSGINGSVVLYPKSEDIGFAKTMLEAVASGMAQYGVQPDGILLKDDLWIHATMPTVTVEPVYLTNPAEAALMTRDDVRASLARAIVAGIEREAPQIEVRRVAVAASDVAGQAAGTSSSAVSVITVVPSMSTAGTPTALASTNGLAPSQPVATPTVASDAVAPPPRTPSEAAAPTPAVVPAGPVTAAPGTTTTSDPGTSVRSGPLRLLMVASGLGLMLVFRRRVLRGLAPMCRAFVSAIGSLGGVDGPVPAWRGVRMRDRADRRRRLLEKTRRSPYRRVVYDELWY